MKLKFMRSLIFMVLFLGCSNQDGPTQITSAAPAKPISSADLKKTNWQVSKVSLEVVLFKYPSEIISLDSSQDLHPKDYFFNSSLIWSPSQNIGKYESIKFDTCASNLIMSDFVSKIG